MTTNNQKELRLFLKALSLAKNAIHGKIQFLSSTYSEKGKKFNEAMIWSPVSYREDHQS